MPLRDPELLLPDELRETFDINLRAVLDVHAEPGFLAQAHNRIEQVQRVERKLPPVLSLSGSLTDETNSAVIILPSPPSSDTRGLKTHMSIMQGALKVPRRILAFPHFAHKPELMLRHAYAAETLDYLESAGIHAIDVVAFESSSRAGALMADVATDRNGIAVNSLTIFEPPNAIDRTPHDLLYELKNFPSSKAMKTVIDSYGLSGVRDYFPHTSRHIGDKKKKRNYIKHELERMTSNDNTWALLKDLAEDSLADDLALVDVFCIKSIVRGWDSGVSPSFRSIKPGTVDHKLEIDGMGREVTTPVIVSRIVKHVLEAEDPRTS
jgi:hypothetical protein